ncbi:BOLA class I histocompatibility antigen, alpha chain BL3-7-like isoform X1 [Pygocentrus nattereri]|uniref:BOLA class I histocompatibility antigen, alpha chain BL3-7-like isoform X1 n=1 Tax=Pygocentrus nattereri TaxID=42514 RepID=UPI001891EC15|nr:BOLA class I histocompatibility antigen, alpha chain BL3-7-like isoform X1 [Pygocentrus nattereri]
MKSLLLLIFTLHLTSADTHSLQFFFTGVTPGISFPELTAVSQVDGLHVGCYDSTSRKVILKVDWIKNGKDEAFWNLLTQTARLIQENIKLTIAVLRQHFNQTEGIHTMQVMFSCVLHDDGSKRGNMQMGYDGEDYISLDLKTLTWTAANAIAVITKENLEKTGESGHWKDFLENTCIEWLQMAMELGRAALERKVSPEVSLFQKDSSSPVVCHATGFFPKAVMISWQKNGEDLHEDVELRETLPNQDGTFQKRSVLTVSPEELNRHNYTCIIQHSSLEKEMVLLVSDLRVSGGVWMGIIIGAVVTVLIIICVFVWMKKKKKKHQSGAVGQSGRQTDLGGGVPFSPSL